MYVWIANNDTRIQYVYHTQTSLSVCVCVRFDLVFKRLLGCICSIFDRLFMWHTQIFQYTHIGELSVFDATHIWCDWYKGDWYIRNFVLFSTRFIRLPPLSHLLSPVKIRMRVCKVKSREVIVFIWFSIMFEYKRGRSDYPSIYLCFNRSAWLRSRSLHYVAIIGIYLVFIRIFIRFFFSRFLSSHICIHSFVYSFLFGDFCVRIGGERFINFLPFLMINWTE